MVEMKGTDTGSPLGSIDQISPDSVIGSNKGEASSRVIELDITRQDDRLKLSVHEQTPGEESTIRHYEEIPVSMDMIQTKCQEMVDTLNKANRQGRLSKEVLVKLRETGQVLHDELFSATVKAALRKTGASYLSLKIDDHLVQVPWELLNDGEQFLCQRFNMGRMVKTQQPMAELRTRMLARPLSMLVLADPQGDLKGAYGEGTQIRDYADQHSDLIKASLRAGNISPDSIKQKLRNFDFVHFAGHADYDGQSAGDSGWRLTGGSLKAKDIKKMAGTGSMPALIFSNACQSARTEEWKLTASFQDEIFGLANSFLLSGVRHYVGTFWEILDEPSSHFALSFYKYLLSGLTMGEAVRQSRQALIREYGEETIVWASYVLYGDPTFDYREKIKGYEKKDGPDLDRLRPREMGAGTRKEVIDFSEKKVPKRHWRSWPTGSLAASLVFFVAMVLWGYPGILRQGTAKYEKEALAYYHDGHFERALDLCKRIEDKDPEAPLAHLIRGNIYLANGKLGPAQAAYEKALQAPKQAGVHKAQAFFGLGRIATFRKDADEALGYYEQATKADPNSPLGYMSQAFLLENRGDYDGASGLLQKAVAAAPQDKILAAISNETREKAALANDQERRERIDRMVKELIESMDAPSRARPHDGWTSPPLTIWVMDIPVKGYPLQEGQDRLLVSGIGEQLLRHSRARLVERALLDKLVEELRLGTSELIDQRTALTLGNILAARLIVTGQMVYSGPQMQVSIRLIETETGQIVAALNEAFGSAVQAATVAERLSKELLKELQRLYPIRGMISEVKDGEIRLNVGEMAGVSTGQRFQVLDQDVTLEVTFVEQDKSLARVAQGTGPLQPGLRVEALLEPKANKEAPGSNREEKT